MAFATIMSAAVIRLPADPHEPFNTTIQPAFEVVFGNTWRIVVASMIAFWAGDFVNSYVLARMKIMTRGKHLWSRFIGSTMLGQMIDSTLFYPIAFLGIWQPDTMLKVVAFNWAFKVAVEVLFMPLTYIVVNALKRAESEDYFDFRTDFTPFSLKD
jgi:uncharacterized integral membrane protein (TIGR00697 family)